MEKKSIEKDMKRDETLQFQLEKTNQQEQPKKEIYQRKGSERTHRFIVEASVGDVQSELPSVTLGDELSNQVKAQNKEYINANQRRNCEMIGSLLQFLDD